MVTYLEEIQSRLVRKRINCCVPAMGLFHDYMAYRRFIKTSLPLKDVTDLLSFCLTTTQVVSEGTCYKQVFGTTMGSPVSAVINNDNNNNNKGLLKHFYIVALHLQYYNIRKAKLYYIVY